MTTEETRERRPLALLMDFIRTGAGVASAMAAVLTIGAVTVVVVATQHHQPPPKPSPARTQTGPVGTVLGLVSSSKSDVARVQLTHIIDPATANGFDPDSGKRFVAAALRVTDTSDQALNGLPFIDSGAVLEGSDGQNYPADDLGDVQECTSFSDGDSYISPGESLNGCIVFQVSTGVSVSQVEIAAGNQRLIWSNR